MKVNKDQCCLLVVDLQKKLFPNIFDKHNLFKFSEKTIELFCEFQIPIIYTEQYPNGLGETITPLKLKLDERGAKKFEKTSFSALETSSIDDYFNLLGKSQVVIIGIEAHICILQTSIDFVDKGVSVFVPHELVGSRKLSDKKNGLDRMEKNGVTLINFEMMFFELIRDAKYTGFKELSSKYIK